MTDLIFETVSKTGTAYYLCDSHAGVSRANGFFVLTLDGEEAISAITRFGDNGVLPYFGLPRTLPG